MRVSRAGWRLPGTRLNRALVFSLAAHALLLSLTFGAGVGLPGLTLPWQDRRAEVPDLRVVLEPTPAAPAEAPALPPEDAATPLAASGEASPPPTPPAPPQPQEIAPPVSGMAVLALERPASWAVPAASAVPTAVVAALPGASSPAVETLSRATEALRPRERSPALSSMETVQPETPTTVVAAFQAASSPAVDTLRRASAELRMQPDRSAELAQLEAARAQEKPAATVAAFQAASSPAVETLRRASADLRSRTDRERTTELSRLEALQPAAAVAALQAASSPAVESLRRTSDALRVRSDTRDRAADLAQLDTARQDAQQSAQRLEAARVEAERQDAARAEAARAEAARREAARLEAARQEGERQEAARQAAARQDAARLEDQRQAAARAAAAKLAEAKAEEDAREARKRAIGKQLDEEAARREAARQRPDWTPARRGRLFGRADANAEMMLYGEAWARKIQMNQTFEMVREAAQQPHVDPIVTVAIRSDGSVETITFVRSSGVPAIDDAVRRIIHSQENYPAFSPALLREYDVVEIRRSWHFDTAIRLN